MPVLDGVAVTIGKRSFTVPPLSLWWSEQLEKPERYTNPRAMGELIHGLLSENYPELTVDEVMRLAPQNPKRLETILKAVVKAGLADTEPAEGEAGRP